MFCQKKGSAVECVGYEDCRIKKLCYYVMVFLSGGIVLLVMHWKPEWKLTLTKTRCPLAYADAVLLKDQYGVVHTEQVICIVENGNRLPREVCKELYKNSTGDESDGALLLTQEIFLRYFDHHKVRYIWDDCQMNFKRLRGLDENMSNSSFFDVNGLSHATQQQKRKIYGRNAIEIELKSYGKLFLEEVVNPFYVFQIFSVILWSMDDYYYYAGCIVAISAISIAVSLYETRKQSRTLRDMVITTDDKITVIRNTGVTEDIPTMCLVPGDVVIIPQHGCSMQCDAVLTAGNCIVNESMLTGESVPVTKTPLNNDDDFYSPENQKRHTLFCGTRVIQTRYYGQSNVTAVVVRTGFYTAKGELVRAILFPKPMDFKFYQDSMRFIGVLALVASCGIIYSTIVLVTNGVKTYKVVTRALDIVTIAVPPALPAAMTVGTVYAQSRMKKENIYCISPPRINICGKLKLICFDKTGTLTEEGLDLWGVVPTENSRFCDVTSDASQLPRGALLAAMATCHSLTVIDGELTGDPLDLKMFEGTKWVFEQPGSEITRFDSLSPTTVRPASSGRTVPIDTADFSVYKVLQEHGQDSTKFDSLVPTIVMPCGQETFSVESGDFEHPYEIGIVRQFTFTSALQCMSVITRTLGSDHMDLYAKGAPEKLASLCLKSTIPDDFHTVLKQYTMQGFRVIAVGYRQLDLKLSWHQAQRIKRDQVECDLKFLGLIVMQNMLKPETTPIIQQLHNAEIRTVMVTGDNMLTAVSVARDCSMVKQNERVILIQAHPPEGGKPASIEWTDADANIVDCESDQDGEGDIEYKKVNHQSINQPLDILVKSRYHFAISGKCFNIIRYYFPELVPKLVVRGTVFARMSPDQKAALVEELQKLDYCVGMCGDGANDCGALKMADAGISLSESEASVASPFTSKTPNIECVPIVIREGRAALVTSFGVFKYMALYSMIQFITVLILYNYLTNLGDFQFLYIDLVITTTVAILMGHTGAFEKLVAERPQGSLLNPTVLFSIFAHILVQVGIQLGALFYLRAQTWYIQTPGTRGADSITCWEGSILFLISAFQYLIMAFVFSQGPPYRKPIWTNVLFLLSLLVLSLSTAYLLLYPAQPIAKFFTLIFVNYDYMTFKLTLLGFPVANLLLSYVIEDHVVHRKWLKDLMRFLKRKKHPRNKYRLVEREISQLLDWPPVGDVTYATKDLDNNSSQFDMKNLQPVRHS